MRAKTLDPILANAGIAAAYQRELDKMIRELFAAHRAYYLDDVISAYQDAGTRSADAKKLTPEEAAEAFKKKADELAAKFLAQSARHINAAFERSLLKAGFTKNDIRKFRKDRTAFNTVIQAMREDNVALIRNIPDEVQARIRESLNKSMENHRDLASMYEDLKEIEGMTLRRAQNVTRDQNNKATEQLSRVTVQSMGITEGVWMHRSIGKTYRKTHVAFNGVKFDLSQGLFDENVGEFVLPAQLPMCHCTYRPLLPDALEYHDKPKEWQPSEELHEAIERRQGEEVPDQPKLAELFEYGMTSEERKVFVEKIADIDSRIDEYMREMGRAFGLFDGDLEEAADKGATRSSLIKKVRAEIKQAERYGDAEEIADAKERLAAIDKYFEARDKMWNAQKERIEMAPLGWPPVTGTEKWQKFDGSRASSDIIDRANPNYEQSRNATTGAEREAYTSNCQRCVPTWELIKRGYNVTALPTYDGDTLVLRRNATSIFKNAPLINVAGKGEIETIAKSWGAGARGQVVIRWSGKRGGGHTFVFENINGKIVFMDPQTHNMDCSDYFKRVARGRTQILRLDIAEVSGVITKVCKEASV